nr:MAG TPA: hypothetical protein [Caudoviricetes sp.]
MQFSKHDFYCRKEKIRKKLLKHGVYIGVLRKVKK